MNNSVATDTHRISPSHFVKVIMRFKTSLIIGIEGVVLLISLVAGYLFNYIFYFIGAAIILIICPIILSFIYLNYALSPETAMLTRPHRIVFSSDKIEIDYHKHDDEKEDDSDYLLKSASFPINIIHAHLVSSDILITSNLKRNHIIAVVPFKSLTSIQNLNSVIQLLNITPSYHPQL
ncbi:MAG: hypothetical protein K2K27_06705 [Muribaculaceae bacterium]|nr:hypothetical protein [Muribaculaceae bacterium]